MNARQETVQGEGCKIFYYFAYELERVLADEIPGLRLHQARERTVGKFDKLVVRSCQDGEDRGESDVTGGSDAGSASGDVAGGRAAGDATGNAAAGDAGDARTKTPGAGTG